MSLAQAPSGDDRLLLGGGTNAGCELERQRFVDVVDRAGADIVGVQEVRARPEDIPPAARRPSGWHTVFTTAERRGYSGVGLYSKLQPIRVDTSLGVPRFDREGRFMAAHFQTACGRFVVVNGYFPKGSGTDRDNSRVGYKLDFSRTVFARAQALRRRSQVLVIGDYNTAHRVIDLARPQANVTHSGFLSEERAELDRWLEAGWVDAFRALHPEAPDQYTWWAAMGRCVRAERRMADRLRLRIAGCDEAHTRGLYLARRTGLRPLPDRGRYRPVADTGTLRRSHTTGMKSKVHPRYKTKYRVANWAAYNQALVRRGDVTVWVSSEAIAASAPGRSGRRGWQRRYSDLAIETALTLRLLYIHLPLRQAEGFLHALFGMMRLDLSAPDSTTLSRRSQHLRRRLRPVPTDEGIHLVLDSTDLSLVGAGEWAAAKHGGRGWRGWRKLHLGVDQSGVIRVHTLTEATGEDATTAIDLLTAVDGPLVRVTADAAYDTVAVYETAGARGATVVIPPAKTATVSGHGPRSPRAGSDDHVGEAARAGASGRSRPGTIVRAGWRTRSSDTNPSSAMAFAPGVQLGRGVRWSSAAKSSIG